MRKPERTSSGPSAAAGGKAAGGPLWPPRGRQARDLLGPVFAACRRRSGFAERFQAVWRFLTLYGHRGRDNQLYQ